MSAIAYKNGTVAADTAGWQNELHVMDTIKILRPHPRTLFAAIGRTDVIDAYLRFVNIIHPDREDVPSPVNSDEEFCGLIVMPDGARIVSGRTFRTLDPVRDMVALGPHADFLYGAMVAGASAEEAVRLAIKWCAFAGGNVQVERIGDG